MTNIEKFKQSPAWDIRYNLPTCSGLNNPMINCAWANMLYEDTDRDPDLWERFD